MDNRGEEKGMKYKNERGGVITSSVNSEFDLTSIIDRLMGFLMTTVVLAHFI